MVLATVDGYHLTSNEHILDPDVRKTSILASSSPSEALRIQISSADSHLFLNEHDFGGFGVGGV